MQIFRASAGAGQLRVNGTAVRCGKDLTLTVTGGTVPHIGAISLAVYEPERESATVSTVTVYSHRDDVLAAKCAKQAAASLACTAAVSVGIHIDNATAAQIEQISRNFHACARQLIKDVSDTMGKETDYE